MIYNARYLSVSLLFLATFFASVTFNALPAYAVAEDPNTPMSLNFKEQDPGTSGVKINADQTNPPRSTDGRRAELTCGTPPAASTGTGGSDPGNDSSSVRGVFGACPNKPMPHICTGEFEGKKCKPSYVKNPMQSLPLLGSDGKKLASGPHTTNNNGFTAASMPVGDDDCVNNGSAPSSGATPRMNCSKTQIVADSPPAKNDLQGRANYNIIKKMHADAAYVMEAAAHPTERLAQKLIANEDASNRGAPLSAAAHLQTLDTVTPTGIGQQKPGDYAALAYDKMLVNPRMTTGGPTPTTAELMMRKLAGLVVGDAVASLSSGTGAVSGYEPSIDGLKSFQNSRPPCTDCKNITSQQIAAIKAPVIMDATHPFTPRWNYKNDEVNEFSSAAAPTDSKKEKIDAGAIKGDIYSTDSDRNVFCSGDKVDMIEEIGSQPGRRKPFQEITQDRIDKNKRCIGNEGGGAVDVSNPCCLPMAFKCKPIPCWKCFGLSGKTKTPPLSTNYTGNDLTILPIYIPTKGWTKIPNKGSMAIACEKLRAPLQMVNQLTLRMEDPTDPNNQLPSGSMPGMAFKDYFEKRMPYMILADTGRPLQDSKSTIQRPTDYKGATAAAVGVGRERIAQGESPQSTSAALTDKNGTNFADMFTPIKDAHASAGGSATNATTDERAALGTNPAGMKAGSIDVKPGNPMAAMAPLVAYQANTIRNFNLNGLGRYAKLFAPGDAVGKTSSMVGGTYYRLVCSQRNDDGTSSECTTAELQNEKKIQTAFSFISDANAGAAGTPVKYYEKRAINWPMPYLGQTCSAKNAAEDKKLPLSERRCFPYFGQDKEPTLTKGIGQAKLGDIVLLKAGLGSESDTEPMQPTLGVVISTNNEASTSNPKLGKSCDIERNCNVVIATTNDGFFPDVAGVTTSWGTPTNRTIYKPGHMPAAAKDATTKLMHDNGFTSYKGECGHPSLATCEFTDWASVEVFNPATVKPK